MAFNPAQLASYDEARALREVVNNSQLFALNPILSGDDEGLPAPAPNPNFPWLPPVVPRVGIYLPVWVAGPHADPEPAEGDRLWLHYRFRNGKQGFNVGLWIDKFKRYPQSPYYVLSALAADVAAA